MRSNVLFADLALILFCLVFTFGCQGEKGAFEAYVKKADEVIIEYNKLIMRQHDIQGKIAGQEDVSADLQKLKDDAIKFRKEKADPFVVKNPELKEIHAHLLNATKAFEDAIAAYAESPGKQETYNELFMKANDELKSWQGDLRKLGKKYNFTVTAKKPE